MNDKTTRVDSVRLVDDRVVLIKQLSGFEKHHRVPSASNDNNRRFIADISERELDADLQRIFSALRNTYGLNRKEISVDGPTDGGGVITMPFFNYGIQIVHSEKEPSKIIWRRSITDIRKPAHVFAGPFLEIFGKQFSVLEISPVEPLDLESIVDYIEEADLDKLKVDYDKDLTWCKFDFVDSKTSVALSEYSIRVISRREVTPRLLLEAFLQVHQEFMATFNLSGIPFFAGPG